MDQIEQKFDMPQIKNWLQSGSINLFGAPFAGKDTQGHRLATLFEAPLIGGGDILRNSVMPDHVRQHHDAGKLIPSEDYLQIVLPYLGQPAFVGKPLILSSVGRWHGEEFGVIEATAEAEHHIKAVIYIKLEERDIWRRWKMHQPEIHMRGHRADDTAEALELRLEEFRIKTLPVLEFYHDLGLLTEVDGTTSKDEVTEQILTALASHASTSP